MVSDATHVILVEGSGDEDRIVKLMMNHFLSNKFYFIVHWDAKYVQPDFSKFKNVAVIPSEKTYWGTSTQIDVERRLFDAALRNCPNFEWVHLVSESDVPMLSAENFLEFFKKMRHSDVEFDGGPDIHRVRLDYFMPIKKLSIRDTFWGLQVHRTLKVLNKIFRINRISDDSFKVYKGSNWVSLKKIDLIKVISFRNQNMFNHTSLADEVYVQSILGENFLFDTGISFKELGADFKLENHRFIDWERGNPYVFTCRDSDELLQNVNKDYSFARKIKSYELAKLVVESTNYLNNEMGGMLYGKTEKRATCEFDGVYD